MLFRSHAWFRSQTYSHLNGRVRDLIGTTDFVDHMDEVTHRAIHFAAGENVRNPVVVFASLIVANQLLVGDTLARLRDCQSFVFTNKDAAAANLRGTWFEYLVHTIIAVPEAPTHDRTFEASPLSGNTQADLTSVTLRCTRARFLEGVDDLESLEPGEYGIGHSSFPAVDGVLLGVDGSVDLLQVTVSENHGIKHLALQGVVDKLQQRGFQPFRLLWVVPDQARLRSFRPQSFLQARSSKVHSRPSEVLREIPQYVVAFGADDKRLAQVASAEVVERWAEQVL